MINHDVAQICWICTTVTANGRRQAYRQDEPGLFTPSGFGYLQTACPWHFWHVYRLYILPQLWANTTHLLRDRLKPWISLVIPWSLLTLISQCPCRHQGHVQYTADYFYSHPSRKFRYFASPNEEQLWNTGTFECTVLSDRKPRG
jgi:hypothetical protein